jgi:peptidoglycan biosynthesis protein MviN/MurJ (putative lipid II flippase)
MITQSTVAIMNRAYYARQDTLTPLAAGIVSIILNIAFGSLFHLYTDLGASGMALSYSIISLVNSSLLLILLHKKMNGIHAAELGSFLIRALPSAAVMGAVSAAAEIGCSGSGSKTAPVTVFIAGDHCRSSDIYYNDVIDEVTGCDIFDEKH